MSSASSGEYVSNRYTDLDYGDLYQSLIDHFSSDPESPFKDYAFSGSNLSQLMKIVSYVTHMTLFHTSLALNEMYFSTARLRGSLVKQLGAYGYVPRRRVAARKYLTLRNSTQYDIEVPEFTELTAAGTDSTEEKKFYTLQAYTVPAGGTLLVTAYQSSTVGGRTEVDIDIYEDNGIASEVNLDVPGLSEQYFVVQTVEGGDAVSWVQYESLDSLQNDLDNRDLTLLSEKNVYFLDESDTGYTLRFSSTGVGATPNPDDGKTLTVKYMECDGAASNGIPTSAFSFASEVEGLMILQDADLDAGASAGPSSGGQDRETVEELRENAVSSYGTQNRAVTEYDYTRLGKANSLIGQDGNIQTYGGEKHAAAKRLGKVFVVAAPPSTSEQKFFTDAEKEELWAYFKNYCVTGITPVVQNPHYINAVVEYNYIFKSLISDTASITEAVNDVIKSHFLSNFGETIYVPQLVEEINRTFGVESAFIKNRFKIIFDTLTDLTGTLKVVPVSSADAAQFVGTAGETYSGYAFGFTDSPTYGGSNLGRVIAVSVDGGYIVLEQDSGVNNVNFARFSKAPSASGYRPRKDLVSIVYDTVPNSNCLYLTDTDGFVLDEDIVSASDSGVTNATISYIDKKSAGKKHCLLQLNKISSGTSVLREGGDIVNSSGLSARVLEVTGTKCAFVKYTSGSDFSEGQDIDFGTSYSSSRLKIAKRATLHVSSVTNGSSSGGTGWISVGGCVIDINNTVGTVESVGTSAAGSGTLAVWYSDSSDFSAANRSIELGTSWTGGTGSNCVIVLLSVGSSSKGVGPVVYKLEVSDVSAVGFFSGTANAEPGDTWRFNRIASVASNTNVITVSDPLRGVSAGDSICNSSNSLTTVVTAVNGNSLTLDNGTGFVAGALLHTGTIWNSLLKADIWRVADVYDETKPAHLVIDTAFYVGSSSCLIQSGASALVTSVGTSTSVLGGTSDISVAITSATGVFVIGSNNTLVGPEFSAFDELCTLDGNITDFSSKYSLQHDEEDGLRYFVNKLDFGDSGMLDASPTDSVGIGKVLVFNTTENLDRASVTIEAAYGTGDLFSMETQHNTRFETTFYSNSALRGTSGATVYSVSVGDTVTMHDGTRALVASVSAASTSNSMYSFSVRHSSHSFNFFAGDGTGCALQAGDAGALWNGSAASNFLSKITAERNQPSYSYYYDASEGTKGFYARVDFSTGDVSVKRAREVTEETISSGTAEISSVDFSNRKVYFADTSDFLHTGGTSTHTIYFWNTSYYDWDLWEYTNNSSLSAPPYLESTNDVPVGVSEGMIAVQDTLAPLRRVEFGFKNQIDRLKLGNRSLFYASKDLITPLEIV